MDRYILKGTLVTPLQKLDSQAVFVKDGTIEKVIDTLELENYPEEYLKKYSIIDAGKNIIGPGFIDIHTHGANDADAVKDPVGPMAEFKVRHGTTTFFPTLLTAEFDRMINACRRIKSFMDSQKKGSRVAGINSEGPYLNPDFGAQKRELVKDPDPADYQRLVEAGGGSLKLMTVAPELRGAPDLIRYLRSENIIASIGHTDISVPEMHKALDLGMSLVTHLFNAMGDPVQYDRGTKPVGIQEELLVRGGLMCELLSDKKGVHVKPALLNIALKCLGAGNIVLITDSMNMTGFPPGTYPLQDGRKVSLEEGADTLRLENDDLAGSVMTMDRAVSNFMSHTGCRLEQAIQMASLNPARAVELSARKGEVRTGMDADIIIFDEDIDVKMTMVGGILEYNDL